MTIQEFNLEFDLLYDNLATRGAPGIDLYEKSVYLTKAQLELVKQYNGNMNKYNKGFDGSEKRRRDLVELIRDFKTNISVSSTSEIRSGLTSHFYRIPADVFLIKIERGYVEDSNCGAITVDIEPVTLDEFNEKIKNPFRRPNRNTGFRLDSNFSMMPIGAKSVEIVTEIPLDEYHIRYVKYPEPIILTDLTAGEFAGMGLTVDGQTDPRTSELDEEIHREILDRAVELAILDYKSNNLQNKVEINKRNN